MLVASPLSCVPRLAGPGWSGFEDALCRLAFLESLTSDTLRSDMQLGRGHPHPVGLEHQYSVGLDHSHPVGLATAPAPAPPPVFASAPAAVAEAAAVVGAAAAVETVAVVEPLGVAETAPVAEAAPAVEILEPLQGAHQRLLQPR